MDVVLSVVWSWPATVGVLVGAGAGWWLHATVGSSTADQELAQ
jgi:hypothetical protein